MPATPLFNATVDAALAADDPGATQNASGQTLLWALIALALTAASQQSLTARRHKFPGSQAEITAGVYRISPLICVFDTLGELYSIISLLGRLSNRGRLPETYAEAQSTRTDTWTVSDGGTGDLLADSIALGSRTAAWVNEQRSSNAAPQNEDTGTQHAFAGEPVPPRQDESVPTSLGTSLRKLFYNIPVFFFGIGLLMSPLPPREFERLQKKYESPIQQYAVNVYEWLRWQSGENCPRPPRTQKGLFMIIDRYNAEYSSVVRFDRMSFASYSVRLAAFVLGALPQAIKIFAISGIAFTHVLAGTYLSAIIVHGIAVLLQDTVGLDREGPRRQPAEAHSILLYVKGSHHILYFWFWQFMAKGIRVPPDTPLMAMCDALAKLLLPVSIVRLVISATIVCSATLSAHVRSKLGWLLWLHAWHSSIYALIGIGLQQKPRPRMPDSEGIRHGIYDAFFGPSSDTAFGLFVLPAAACIGVAQLMRWTYRAVDAAFESYDLQGHDPDEVIMHLRRIHADMTRDIAEGDRRRAQEPGIWREHFRQGFQAVMSVSFMPIPFWSRLHYLYSKLDPDVQWSAFLLFNILTLTVYYLLCFDGSTSVQPAWLTVFGRRI